MHVARPPSMTTILLTSALITFGIVHYGPHYMVLDSAALTFLTILSSLCFLFIIYISQIWPKLLSPIRNLPSAPNPSLWHGQISRLLKERTGKPELEWINTVPNEGLIRFTSLFNTERILLTSPEALKEVLVTKCYEFPKPEMARLVMERVIGSGILLAEGEEHKLQRKNLMPAFQYRHVKDLVPTFWSKSAQMIRKVDEENAEELKSADGAVIKLMGWISRCTLDIIGVAGMGVDFNAINDPDGELTRAYRGVFSPPAVAQWLRLMVLFAPTLIHVLRALPMKRNAEMAEATQTIRRVSREVIQKKKQKLEAAKDQDVGKDILSVALTSGAFAEENLVDQTMTFLAAGHETTSSATSWAMLALSRDQRIQEKLREEVRRHLPSPSDEGAIVTAEMIDKCHYLHAVCNEVLRFYAPVPLTRREAARDTTILGVPIKQGTDIIIMPSSINMSEALWGEDAQRFNPDRWLDKNANSGGASSNFAMLTFLQGPRSCIGQAFSKHEFACLLASIVGHYRFELADKSKKVGTQRDITVRPKELDLRMRVVGGW